MCADVTAFPTMTFSGRALTESPAAGWLGMAAQVMQLGPKIYSKVCGEKWCVEYLVQLSMVGIRQTDGLS